jgi:hypothetical protein
VSFTKPKIPGITDERVHDPGADLADGVIAGIGNVDRAAVGDVDAARRLEERVRAAAVGDAGFIRRRRPASSSLSPVGEITRMV